MGVTNDLATFVTRTDYENLPENVVEHAKLCILDWLGAALAGSLEPPAKIIRSIINETGGRKESTVIGTRTKTSCMNAALANGIMGHTVELDDLHMDSIVHPAAPVLPASLATAESSGSSGQDLIAAVVLGYEVEIRIGLAMNPSHYEYWHNTGTCGTFGAAAAAGKILDLDEEKMNYAFGIAGTEASGLIDVFGTMSKPLNAGKAAQCGVTAAMLAKRGFTSSNHVLESNKGYCRAASSEPKLNSITEDLGRRFEILNDSFKRHASCGHTHPAIDASLDLAEKHGVKPDAIERIVVETYPIAVETVGRRYEPKTSSEGKFSLPYCVAVALACGKVGVTEFSSKRLKDPEVLKLSRKVSVETGGQFNASKLWWAKVRLRKVDGTELSCTVDVPKGHPGNPLSNAELEKKFRDLAALALPPRKVNRIITTVRNLESLKNVKSLTTLLKIGFGMVSRAHAAYKETRESTGLKVSTTTQH
jgi:2-methylcitrate dehydratase PrpD